MGCIQSTASFGRKRGSLRKARSTNDTLQRKITIALAKKVKEQAKLEHPMTLERILLKFDKMQDVLGYVKDIFVEVSSGESSIDFDGLLQVMKKLKGSSATEEEVKEIFNFSDLTENVRINLKEFVVALTLGVVLESIDFGVDKVKLTPSPRRASISSFFGHPKEIYDMLSLIVSAYLLFDAKGEGMIHEDAVEKLLEESGHKAGNNAMLSHARWQELDWDSDGTIDLAEFVNAFTDWIDLEEQLA